MTHSRELDGEHLSETADRRDAGNEPPWMASRRVSDECYRFRSRIKARISSQVILFYRTTTSSYVLEELAPVHN
jgi:hypothetical protein